MGVGVGFFRALVTFLLDFFLYFCWIKRENFTLKNCDFDSKFNILVKR